MELKLKPRRNLTQSEKEKMLSQAVANAEIEGFVFSDDDKKTIMALFDKKISREQVIKQLQQKSEERKILWKYRTGCRCLLQEKK